jgi:hypothetical protein
VKKALRWLLIAVLALWLIQNPAQAAHLAHAAMHGLSHATHAVSVLVSSL